MRDTASNGMESREALRRLTLECSASRCMGACSEACCRRTPASAPGRRRPRGRGPIAHLAVGETVILLTSPSPSLLKHLLTGEGDAAE